MSAKFLIGSRVKAQPWNNFPSLTAATIKTPSLPSLQEVADNADLFIRVSTILEVLSARVDAATAEITAAISTATQELEAVRLQWQTRYKDFQAKLDAELEKIDRQSSLTSLRTHLGPLQQKLANVKAAGEELNREAIPELQALEAEREGLIDRLHAARKK